MDSGTGSVSTDAWELRIPDELTHRSPLLVIPTVHPRGDRRVVRCAQVALDAGFRITFVWLGHGAPSSHWAAREIVLPPPTGRWDRLALVSRVARRARHLSADGWHIHDFYFLPAARAWHRRTGRPVVYDVHEYYGTYYAGKVPVPDGVRSFLAGRIDRYQVRAAKAIGGADVVSEEIARIFRKEGVPVAVSPNYPLLEHFERRALVPFHERRWRVLHTGTLTPEYGTERLVALAQRSLERGLKFEFSAIARFPSRLHEATFMRLLADVGGLPNLQLLPPRPTHDMADLVGGAGFGLSLLDPGGQRDLAIASKLYEHVMLGLVNVITNRPAQRSFINESGLGVVSETDDVDELLDGMLGFATAPHAIEAELDEMARKARARFTWEAGVAPGLESLLRSLVRS